MGTPIREAPSGAGAGGREGRSRRDGATAPHAGARVARRPGLPSLALSFPICTGGACPELRAAPWPTRPRTSSLVLPRAGTSRARWVWLRPAPQTAGCLRVTLEEAAHLDSEVVGLERKPGAAWVPGGARPPTLPEPFMGTCRAGRPLRFWGGTGAPPGTPRMGHVDRTPNYNGDPQTTMETAEHREVGLSAPRAPPAPTHLRGEEVALGPVDADGDLGAGGAELLE